MGGHNESYAATTAAGLQNRGRDGTKDNEVDMTKDFRTGTTHPYDMGSSMCVLRLPAVSTKQCGVVPITHTIQTGRALFSAKTNKLLPANRNTDC